VIESGNVVALIDAGGANLGSVRYALEREGATVEIVRDADGLRGTRRVILPGVGAAPPAMKLLRERGLVDALRQLQVPLLGICLGMQLLFESSEEGDVACLGVLPGSVRRLSAVSGIRVPHMGWNQMRAVRDDALLQDIRDGAQAYFVHSYAAPVTQDCVAACTHGERFAAVVRRGNVMGAQFHPERSAGAGAMLLRNFLAWAA
jgi:imidazole glycerol-phosphate synthase subunit HisH